MSDAARDIHRDSINTIRTLSMDAVQQANSGHPGTPMALAPLAYRLYTRHLRHDPEHPEWADRDRFVLSCGHASMLIYSVLHLSGYDVSLDDLKNFRQLGAPTAGHPERGHVPGVEFTTGPLGQGIASAVGMAIAERALAARFNRDGHSVVDHHTYVIASDGDIMEGVQAEAASIAGHLELGRLIVFFDDNRITIDGTTEISMTEDVAARYRAYGWNVLHLDDVEDLEAIDAAVASAKAQSKPTLVVTRTHIGVGSPLVDSPKAHGAPLGAENIRITKEAYGWPVDATFLVPDEVRSEFRRQVAERAASRSAWNTAFGALQTQRPEVAAEFERCMSGRLPEGWETSLTELADSWVGDGGRATRQASAAAINAVAPHVPELVGGSADLAGSNLTTITGADDMAPGSFGGRNINFGIREHAMGSILNGILAHGGLRPFGGTFLIFSDYMRPAIRLAALMELPAIYVYTHDSIYLGEDGPTHQPIEQLASLRAMPGLVVLRPAESVETAHAWRVALAQTHRPVALALSRQKLATLGGAAAGLEPVQVERGGYVLREASSGTPDVILIGTGSEVELCLAAAEQLEADGTATRVVSMPSVELFAEQDASYRNEVLLPGVRARVSVEAGATFGWHRWVGDHGVTIGIDRFGLSAPAEQAAAALGLTVEAVTQAAHTSIAQAREFGAVHG